MRFVKCLCHLRPVQSVIFNTSESWQECQFQDTVLICGWHALIWEQIRTVKPIQKNRNNFFRNFFKHFRITNRIPLASLTSIHMQENSHLIWVLSIWNGCILCAFICVCVCVCVLTASIEEPDYKVPQVKEPLHCTMSDDWGLESPFYIFGWFCVFYIKCTDIKQQIL